MTKSKQLAINTIIVGISRISTALAVFVVLPVYTKYLSAEEYGLVDLVTVYAALIVPLITLRLELAVFRWLVDSRNNIEKTGTVINNVLRIVLVSSIAFSVLFWMVNSWIAIPYAALIYFYIIASVVSGIFLQVARGLGNIRIFALSGIVNGVFSAVIGVTLVVAFGMGLDGVLWGMLIGVILASLLVLVTMRLPMYFAFKKDTLLQKEMILFSLPMIPNGLSSWAIFAGSKVIISFTLGVAANGVYAVAGRFNGLFGGIYEIFNITWTESASLHINAKDRNDFFTKTINSAIMFFGSMAIVFIAVLPIIFPILVDDSFSEAYYFIPLLTIGFLFDTTVRMIGALYVALRLTKQVMYTTITAATISIIGTLLFINMLGLWAPVLATLVAFMSMAIFRYFDIRKRGIDIKIRPSVILTVISGLALVVATYYLFGQTPIIHVAVFIAACCFAIYVNRKMIRLVVSLRAK